jgi:hypothetical protein
VAYATEADYRAALKAYRALHEAFYRFYKIVRVHPPPPDDPRAVLEAIATTEHDHRRMVGELLPALARTYGGPRHYVERLGDTLQTLGAQHVSSPQAPFDADLAHQAYIDVDNILESLLSERESYPAAFDAAFVDNGTDPAR